MGFDPEKVEKLAALWLTEAKKHKVLPLIDVGVAAIHELEFHAATELDDKAMTSRYVELNGSALKNEPRPTDYLGDIDSSFYVTGYLRSWALQAQLRNHFRDRFGSTWFSSREAGSMLRELWGEGSRLNADELLADVAGEELEMEAFAESLRELLK